MKPDSNERPAALLSFGEAQGSDNRHSSGMFPTRPQRADIEPVEVADPPSGGSPKLRAWDAPAWFDDVPVALLGLDNLERLVWANQQAAALLCLNNVEWVGRPVQAILTIASSLRAELCAAETEVHTRRVIIGVGGAPTSVALSIRRVFDYIDIHYICSLSPSEPSRGAGLEPSHDLAAMGQMIAGCAHEMKNPIAALTSILEDLSVAPEPCVVTRAEVARLAGLVARLDRLAQGSLRLVRTDNSIRKNVKVASLVESALDLLEPKLRALGGPSIARDCVPDDAVAVVDEHQMVQVLVILLDNALDAAGSASHVRVRARVEPTSGDGRATSSTRVLIDIEDDGPGMSPEVISKIFRPFFTRKRRGTGLGLSIAQKLVRENNGRIWVRSSFGHGSVFSVDVPGVLT